MFLESDDAVLMTSVIVRYLDTKVAEIEVGSEPGRVYNDMSSLVSPVTG